MSLLSPPLVGLLYSLLCLIPGFGTAQVLLLAYNSPDCLPYAICGSLILNSVKEVSMPLLSGNLGTMSLDRVSYKINPYEYFNSLVNHKLFCWVIGGLVGLFVPDSMLPREVVIIIVLGLILKVRKVELPSVLLYLSFVGIIYILVRDSSNVVLIISLVMFNIPQVLNIKLKKSVELKEKYIPNIIVPNYALLTIGGLLVSVAPGLSSSVIFSQINTNHKSTEMSATLADTIIESIGLILLLKNMPNGKSLIGDLVAVGDLNMLIKCTGVICISYCIITLFGKALIGFYEENENSLIIISSILSIINLIQLTKYGLILAILSIVVSLIISEMKTPQNLRGYTFTVPLIFS